MRSSSNTQPELSNLQVAVVTVATYAISYCVMLGVGYTVTKAIKKMSDRESALRHHFQIV